jgi:hypothetical protein
MTPEEWDINQQQMKEIYFFFKVPLLAVSLSLFQNFCFCEIDVLLKRDNPPPPSFLLLMVPFSPPFVVATTGTGGDINDVGVDVPLRVNLPFTSLVFESTADGGNCCWMEEVDDADDIGGDDADVVVVDDGDVGRMDACGAAGYAIIGVACLTGDKEADDAAAAPYLRARSYSSSEISW